MSMIVPSNDQWPKHDYPLKLSPSSKDMNRKKINSQSKTKYGSKVIDQNPKSPNLNPTLLSIIYLETIQVLG